MARIFTETWADGTFDAWSKVATSPPLFLVPRWGCSSDYAFTCQWAPNGVSKNFDAILDNVTVRIQFAILAGSVMPDPEASPFLASFMVLGSVQAPDHSNLFLPVGVAPDGSFFVAASYSPGSPLTVVYSDPGAFPIDSQYHGIQVLANFFNQFANDFRAYYDIYVDNVLKASFSDIPVQSNAPYDLKYIQSLSIGPLRGPNFGDSNTYNTSYSYIEVDDARLLTNFPACGAGTRANMCSGGDQNITDLAINCDAQQIILTGTGFDGFDDVSLSGPSGPETFDVISQTATQIVLGNLDPPFVSGANYCATARSSHTVCDVLNCITPPITTPPSWQLHRFDYGWRREGRS